MAALMIPSSNRAAAVSCFNDDKPSMSIKCQSGDAGLLTYIGGSCTLVSTNAREAGYGAYRLDTHYAPPILRPLLINDPFLMCRSNSSWSCCEVLTKRTPIPNPGAVLATSPFSRSLVSPSHSAILRLVSTFNAIGISTKQPPTLKSEALPRTTGCPAEI